MRFFCGGVEKFSRGWLKNFRGVEIFLGGVEIFRRGLEFFGRG